MKNLATSAAGLPDSVWQRRAPSKFGIASNADLAEARGQQALQASFNKRQAREKWFIFLTRHASTSVPGQRIVEPLLSCSSLVEQACRVKTVWFHM
jgi:hypothetical protein